MKGVAWADSELYQLGLVVAAQLAGGDIRRLFLVFGEPVCADRISNCPLDRVLTYKNLIYLLNLQIVHSDYFHIKE